MRVLPIFFLMIGLMPAVSHAEDPSPHNQVEIGFDTKAGEISDGDVRVLLTQVPAKPGAEDAWPKPRMEILVDGHSVGAMTASGSGSDSPPATATLIDLDASRQGKEVVFNAWTGGAHCCAEIFIGVSSAGPAWQIQEVGSFDGEIEFTDHDKDGTFEITARNDAFNYAFGCYACSVVPLQILVFENGVIRDATHDERFIPVHRDYLRSYQEDMDANKGPLSNGFLAGWVALKILVGEGQDAWRVMLDRHDQKDDWGLVTCSKQEPDYSCKPENEVRRAFPQALNRFLSENGYEL